ISTNIKVIDDNLYGGIAIGKITELVGLSGTGKTQLWQLCLNVQIPKRLGGLEGKALYIDTKKDFNPATLRGLAIALEQQFLKKTAGNFKSSTMIKNVHYVDCSNTAQLVASIFNLKRYMRANPSIKLIVVDSLPFSIRMLENVWERTKLLMELHDSIQQLLCNYFVAVVVTNELGYYRIRRKWRLRTILGDQHTTLINERIWLTKNAYYIGKTLKRRKLLTSI
ncbi:hypothetical protein KR093_003680, partial [Drosophila rubida]